MTDEEAAEAKEFGEQLEVAAATIRAAVLQLLQAGEVDPRLIVLAAAQVAGELGAATALASGRQEAEDLLDELAEVVRQSGRDHHEALKVALLPTAGRA
jgi:signal recognition particle GTPase